jgi:hypothetical protein
VPLYPYIVTIHWQILHHHRLPVTAHVTGRIQTNAGDLKINDLNDCLCCNRSCHSRGKRLSCNGFCNNVYSGV